MLNYPWTHPPEVGEATPVTPDVLWLRMPMPLALDHINLWALRDVNPPDGRPGWAIVDTGLHTPDTVAAWETLLSASGPLGGQPVTRVIVTHMHPDHVGQAGWLAQRFDVPMWMTRLEYLSCRVMVGDTGREAPKDGIDFCRRAGWPDDAIAVYRRRFGSFGRWIHRLPDSFRRLEDGLVLRIGAHDWRIVVGSGHSPEHACLYCDELKMFISGDQVLPRITSNVSVFPTEPHADPISDWLRSIDKLKREVQTDVLTLPAHNLPFQGLHDRLDDLVALTGKAIDRLLHALLSPKRVVDLFDVLFERPISDPLMLHLATGEAQAVLNRLLHRQEVVADHDARGVTWYRRA